MDERYFVTMEKFLKQGDKAVVYNHGGKFRQMLTDLIKTKHNSNHKTHQTNLKGEIIQEYTYYVLGFVPADIIRLKKTF